MTKKDARGLTITYTYDTLNRMTGRTYSNSDPAVGYSYDQTTCVVVSTCYNVGRRTSMTDAGGSESWAYDKMGREWGEQRSTNSITKNTGYTYNFDGSLATLTYPSGRTITYVTDSAGRPSEAQDLANNVNYAEGTCANGVSSSGVCYAPQSAVASLVMGLTGSFTGITTSDTYNIRLQPNEVKATSTAGTAMDLSYEFEVPGRYKSDNGNVLRITNNLDTTRSQVFTYDQLNRLLTAETTSTFAISPANCWGEAYIYDNNTTSAGEFGNLTNINVASTSYNGCTQESLSVTALSNNQLSATGFSYDASGNLLADGTNTYGFNAESEIKSAAGVNYTYDGDGNRIQKSGSKIYWYGLSKDPLAESDLSGDIQNEYVFFGGKRLARRDSTGNVVYYLADYLGTSRVVTNSSGTVLDQSDFYPFGGERVLTSASGNTYKFTSKERDAESGLDNFGARYHASKFGRFMSPDPVSVMTQKLLDPQQWNMYTYVRNNPLRLVDNNGKWPTKIHEQIIDNAFPGLSSRQRQVLKDASRYMDRIPGGQTRAHNHEHAMKVPGEDPSKAKAAINESIKSNEEAAKTNGGSIPDKVSELNDVHLYNFGEALHTVEDRTSPAHTDANGDPKDWKGLPTSLADKDQIDQHMQEEANITPDQMNAAVAAAQQAFTDTFGSDLEKQAEQPPVQNNLPRQE